MGDFYWRLLEFPLGANERIIIPTHGMCGFIYELLDLFRPHCRDTMGSHDSPRVVAAVMLFSLVWASLCLTSSGCLQEEKLALLELKASLLRSNCTTPASWVEEKDCCSWKGVECSNSSRRARGLHLSGLAVYETGSVTYLDQSWHLDFSIFKSFHALRRLDLSDNVFDGPLASQDFTGLRKLTYLDLSSNRFTGGIPTSLTAMRSLQVLWLRFNLLSGPFPVEVLGGLPELRKLHLEENKLNGSLPQWLGKHDRIQYIDLSKNRLEGSIPPHAFSDLASLQYVDLSGNLLRGSIPQWAFSNLSSLQYIDLSGNLLRGSIPQWAFSNLSFLQYIDLSENLLEGEIPKWAFSNLTCLVSLYLSDNLFLGNFPLPSFANQSKLEELIISRNTQLGLETNFQHTIPSFQLRILALSKCNLRKNFLTDATFLSSQHQLEVIDLSSNGLSGSLPAWFLRNYTRLAFASLRNNTLTGQIHLPTQPFSSVQGIDLSENALGGFLPPSFGFIFPNLLYLNLSMNHLVGHMPPSFANLSQLEEMDLSNNHFSGQILPCRCFYLKLSNNNLQGEIPSILPSISFLDGNNLTGTIPRNLSGSSGLNLLDVHDNQLSGKLNLLNVDENQLYGNLPFTFTGLRVLILRGNHFYGHIPPHLCNLRDLGVLDLSHNNFSGAIPSCTVPLHLVYLNLGGNAFHGSFPRGFVNTSELVSLNVKSNQFSSVVPSWFGDLLFIRILLLGENNFQGSIPTQLCKLQCLQILDLHQNNFSGSIPPCFGNMRSMNMTTEEFEGNSFWVYVDFYVGMSAFYLKDTSIRAGDIGLAPIELTYDLEEVQFFTKGNSYSYKSQILTWMVGINLSSNRLTGNIPLEIGNLTMVKALNVSYNQLTGPIPATFSNLKDMESLDMSHNHLSGIIPTEFSKLKSLEVFSVAHNNLSGCTPDFEGQFATFGVESYEGNVGLHGPPLDKSCIPGSIPHNVPHKTQEDGGKDGKEDIIFYAISAVSFVLFFWVTVALLHLNRTARRVCFTMVDRFADNTIVWFSLVAKRLKSTRK